MKGNVAITAVRIVEKVDLTAADANMHYGFQVVERCLISTLHCNNVNLSPTDLLSVYNM